MLLLEDDGGAAAMWGWGLEVTGIDGGECWGNMGGGLSL